MVNVRDGICPRFYLAHMGLILPTRALSSPLGPYLAQQLHMHYAYLMALWRSSSGRDGRVGTCTQHCGRYTVSSKHNQLTWTSSAPSRPSPQPQQPATVRVLKENP